MTKSFKQIMLLIGTSAMFNFTPITHADLLPLQSTTDMPAFKDSSKKSDDNADSLIDRLNTVASSTVKKFTQSGMASWYGRQFHGRKSANGERFDMNALTAAHRSLPLNCYIRVTNNTNGKSVVVKVTDRGPFHGNRVLDLSYGAAQRIGIASAGVGNVSIERVDGPRS